MCNSCIGKTGSVESWSNSKSSSIGNSTDRTVLRRQCGITLVEVVLALAILGIIVGIAMPTLEENRRKIERSEVLAEMFEISNAIDQFFYDNTSYPDSLDQVQMQDRVDSWGNPYQYLRINGAAGGGEKGKGKGGLGGVRKDKNLVPINTDYDLYSMGPDGRSVGPLTAKHSRDDIVRANNGGYLGVAEGY